MINKDKEENPMWSSLFWILFAAIFLFFLFLGYWWYNSQARVECLIALSPIYLSLLLILLIIPKLKDYDLKQALSENEHPEPQEDNPNSFNNISPPASASRLVVFITSLAAIIIAISCTSAYLYKNLILNQTLNLDGFGKFLGGLGIGAVPYIVNKWVSKLRNTKNKEQNGKTD